jgi:hypothetical protein
MQTEGEAGPEKRGARRSAIANQYEMVAKIRRIIDWKQQELQLGKLDVVRNAL